MDDRMSVEQAERDLQAAGYGTTRDQCGGLVFSISALLPRGAGGTHVPTVLQAWYSAADGHEVSTRSVRRLIAKARRYTNP